VSRGLVIVSEILYSEHFLGWRSIASATDQTRSIKFKQLETMVPVQPLHPTGRLIRDDNGSLMFSEPFR
jgi:hypothetical protein